MSDASAVPIAAALRFVLFVISPLLLVSCTEGGRARGLTGWEVARPFESGRMEWSPYRLGANLRGARPVPVIYLRTTIPSLTGIADPAIYLGSIQHLMSAEVEGGPVWNFANIDNDGDLKATGVFPVLHMEPGSSGRTLTLRFFGGHMHTLNMHKTPIVGTSSAVIGQFFLFILPPFALGSLFLALGLLALALMFFGRNPLIPPFAIFSIGVGAFVLLQNDSIYPLLGSEVFLNFFGQMGLYTVPIGLALFVERLTARTWPRRFIRYIRNWHILVAGIALVCLLTPWIPASLVNTSFNYVTIPSALLLTCITLFQLLNPPSPPMQPAAEQDPREMTIFTVGLLVLWAGGLHDMVAIAFASLLGMQVFPYAALSFDLILGGIIARRFFRNRRNLEIYALNLEKTRDAYARFVPREFLSHLGKGNIIDVELGDQVFREMTILFADIRAFTTLSESMTPKENFEFVNAYLGRVGPLIRRHGGFIDKYIGDAVMALFEDPASGLTAAVDMLTEVERYNEKRKSSGYPPLQIGIGLHCGPLILGMVGEKERLQGTVIADAVNLASRLEGLTKEFGASIVISENVLGGLSDPGRFQYRFLAKTKVKGKDIPVSVFEVLDGLPEMERTLKSSTRGEFERAVMLFFDGAQSEARAHLQKINELGVDPAVAHYLKRIQGTGN